jgi:ribosomal protein S18 acetylase RimI-like enzyme
MEIANSAVSGNSTFPIRVAHPKDAPAILRLLDNTSKQHIHVDWHTPNDWLGIPSFFVASAEESTPSQSSFSKFIGKRENFIACMAAAADAKPVAWMRLVIMQEKQADLSLFSALLNRVESALRMEQITQIAWLVVTDWLTDWLPSCGFSQINHIETYIKTDPAIPELLPIAQLSIRTAVPPDYPQLEKIEAAAFAPLWQHNQKTFQFAANQAFSFDIAELNNQIVGFQLSSKTPGGAHLVRMTVHPQYQKQGIGSHLLAHAIRGYHRRGLHYITLNTQIDNVQSQKLYTKFGFRSEGQIFPIWAKKLT